MNVKPVFHSIISPPPARNYDRIIASSHSFAAKEISWALQSLKISCFYFTFCPKAKEQLNKLLQGINSFKGIPHSRAPCGAPSYLCNFLIKQSNGYNQNDFLEVQSVACLTINLFKRYGKAEPLLANQHKMFLTWKCSILSLK